MPRQMMATVSEQPQVWARILDSRESLCAQALPLWAGKHRVLLVGSGSSYNAALCAQHFFEDELGMETVAVTSTGAPAKAMLMNPAETLAVAVSQSGKSTNTEAAVAQLRARGFCVVTLTADETSPVAKAGDAHVPIACGTETVPAKTKGMTATALTLYLLGVLAAKQQGRVTQAAANRLLATLSAAVGNAAENIRRATAFCASHINALATQPHYTLVADGAGLPAAAEGALKLLETFYAPAFAYEFEEYLHGVHNTMAKGRAHFFLPTHANNLPRMDTMLAYSDALGCLNWKITTLPTVADGRTLALLGTGSPHTAPFETLLFFQVLSALGSEYLGYDCDHPRFADFYTVMSTKSVTGGV